MAYGRVNVGGGKGIKETKIKETLQASKTDTTTEYKLIETNINNIEKLIFLDGYVKTNDKYTSNLYINGEEITQTLVSSGGSEFFRLFSRINIKLFSVKKTDTNFQVTIIFDANCVYSNGDVRRYAGNMVSNFNFPLDTQTLKITSKTYFASSVNGIIEKDYTLYSI